MLFRMTLLTASVLVATSASAEIANRYDVIELPTLCTEDNSSCGDVGFAYDINNQGVVTGYSRGPLVPDTEDVDDDDDTTELILDFPAHAYRWQNNAITDLGDFGKNESYGFAINDAGVVVGRGSKVTAEVDGVETVQLRAFQVTEPNALMDLGVPTETVNQVSAGDIAEDGHIVGYANAQVIADSTSFLSRGFVWSPSTQAMTLIPSLETESASALRAVNSSAGIAVGYAYKEGFQRAIKLELADPGILVELDGLGGSASTANAVNNSGVVVGSSQVTENKSTQGFVYDASKTPAIAAIGLLDENFVFSSANAINSNGLIVGVAQASSSPTFYHAVAYDSAMSTPVLVDLNTRIHCDADPLQRWVLAEAVAVNDAGEIIGYGSKGSVTKAFLLRPASDGVTPVQCESPESEFENKSGSTALVAVLLLPLLWWRRRTTR